MADESTLFKDVFFKAGFIRELADALEQFVPGIDKKAFERKVFDKDWQKKELKQRVRHITVLLHGILPKDFPQAAGIITSLSQLLKKNVKDVSF